MQSDVSDVCTEPDLATSAGGTIRTFHRDLSACKGLIKSVPQLPECFPASHKHGIDNLLLGILKSFYLIFSESKMSTLEEFQTVKTELSDLLDQLSLIEVQSLGRSERLGDLSFDTVLYLFEKNLSLYKKLSSCTLEEISYPALVAAKNSASRLLQLLNEVKNFSLTDLEIPAPEKRRQLIQRLIDQYDVDYSAVSPILAFASKDSADLARLDREAKGLVSELKQMKSEAEVQSEALINNMTHALKQIHKVAAEAGVSQHAQHFQTEANNSKKLAFYWLIASIALAVCTFSYVFWHLEPALLNLKDANIAGLMQVAIPRFIMIFVLGLLLSWTIKNFNSSLHNYVVNRHRTNSLASFQTFAEGTDSDAVKNAVLLQATTSIFTPQDTGYTKIDLPTINNQIMDYAKIDEKSKNL